MKNEGLLNLYHGQIEDFENWAKNQAKGELNKHKELTTISKLDSLREMIIKLNDQQRIIFDDFNIM